MSSTAKDERTETAGQPEERTDVLRIHKQYMPSNEEAFSQVEILKKQLINECKKEAKEVSLKVQSIGRIMNEMPEHKITRLVDIDDLSLATTWQSNMQELEFLGRDRHERRGFRRLE